ncbi:nucleolar pre-ribosomal-associated protein 1 [Chanos chanos]|uniref:Nucleolar pre-ribosomal-associated protein 1 n=1 Tax=Chanos chanos TaxID=29144 RepID=A0A6J2VP74_CHACN|nr:nucleolar pre-ribosomal-associated protein 1 [Chanos chanos]
MAKKRQSQDSIESKTPQKKSKSDVSEFNGTAFKSMLKDPSKACKGLETFIATAKKLPCADLYDVVEGYIKISVDCAEIFKLLEGDSHAEDETMLVFHSLEMILLRTASDLSHFSMVGSAIVKKITSTHMKLLQTSLFSENHRFVRRCLSFLSAMVSQGTEAAREVFSHIHFSKSLFGLAKRRDKLGRPDIRMAYIQFALSFLVSGDNATIGQILEMKEFLGDILNTGLKEERLSTVSLILSTLKTKVVQNKAISKTQKVRFFTSAILAQIASLYRWNGAADIRTDETKAENPEEAGKSIVRELVHGFLLDLCCSRKHGISFHDPSFGTAGRAGNIVLLQFLVGLKTATEDELVAELVVGVLKECPDLLSRYFKETQYTFTPRVKSVWQDNVTLLKKIYEAQPEVSKAFQTRELVPLPRLLTMVTLTSLPPVCTKAFFTQGLSLSNTVVQHTTLSFMAFILKRAQKNIEYCLDASVWQNSDIYTPALMEEFVALYREALSKVLPDVTTIVSNWQTLMKKEKGGDWGKKGRAEGDPPEEKTKAAEHGQDDPKVILLKALILQVLCLYQRVVPHLITQSKFDFSKLLQGIMLDRGKMKEDVPPILQYQILQLALELPAGKFSWFRLQEVSVTTAGGGERSVFHSLLKMFVSSNERHLKTSTRMLVLKVLRDSGVFEHTWKELELWLNGLVGLESDQQETVIQFLDQVLMRVVCNPHTYTDKVATLVQEAAYLQASLSGQDADAASIPISHIDDVLDMVDVIMEGSDGDVEEFGPSLTDDIIVQTFPFSAVVPAVLEARNKLPATSRDEKGVLYEYLCAVLCDVLHSQRDPLALCLTLQQYDKELHSSENTPPHPSIAALHQYYSKWLPQQSQEALFEACESASVWTAADGFTAFMKTSYSEGLSLLLQDSFKQSLQEALATLTVSQFPIAVNQTLLYIKSSVDSFSLLPKDTSVQIVGSLMGILHDLVIKLQTLEEPGQPEQPVEPQEGAEFFLETSSTSFGDVSKEEVLQTVLKSIFKHPALEQWFLALELGSLPPHSLNPVRLKRLCARLTEDILTLLQSSACSLRDLDSLELIGAFLSASQRSLMRELEEKRDRCPVKESLPVKVFLALHEYMDFSSLKDVVSTLLLLPQETLVAPGDSISASELSVYGQVVLRVLTESMARPSRDGTLILTHTHLRGVTTLFSSCQNRSLEDFLLQVLEKEPSSAKLIPSDVLLRCVERDSPSLRTVGSLLLQNSPAHRLAFEMWCLDPDNLSRVTDNSSGFLCLLNSYLRRISTCSRLGEVRTAALAALRGTLQPRLWCALQREEETVAEDRLTQQVQILSTLIKLAGELADVADVTRDLPAVLRKPEGYERWMLADVVSEKLAECAEEQQESWRKSLLNAALCWLVGAYNSCKEQKNAELEKEEAMLQRVQTLLVRRSSPGDITGSDWNSFVKTGLKYRYRDHVFLSTLNTLLDLMYGDSNASKDLLPLATIHMMATSHSLFLPTMLGAQDDLIISPQAKEALVSVLLTLVKKSPELCNSSHLLVLLGAYGATLSTTDQKLLLLLQEYEKNNVSLVEFQSLLWGLAAVEHHKARKSLGPSLWQQPSSEELLALLTADRMFNSIAHFPQQRRIIPQEGKELIYREEGDGALELGSLYDPCFLLPLFSSMLRPECAVDCLKFVTSHALGFTVAALSSYDPKMRAAAYQVLGSFYQHLEGARFREKRQLLYLLDTVKNGIKKQNLCLPSVLITYVAKVAQQMLKPEEHMYMVLNKFLLGHQYLDLKRVPEFFKLFYSFDLEHKLEREWILSVLEEGVTDRSSYEVCEEQGIYHSLLGFCSSPLCDESTQIQIVRVLKQTAGVTKAAYNLTKAHGILSWSLQIVERKYLDCRLLDAIIELLGMLWFTNLGQKESRAEERNAAAADEPQGSVKCLPLPLINDFQYVLTAIIRHLRIGVHAPQLKLLLQMLASVLRHRGTALRAHADAGWLTLRPQALSCTEALCLLQHWAMLSHNASLVSSLKTLGSQQRVKELLGSVTERPRGRGSSAKLHRHHPTEQVDGIDGEAEKNEQFMLEDCKPFLRSILTYWAPGPIPACTSPEPRLNSDPSPVDKPDTSDLVTDAALLLMKWTLQSLTESSYDETETAGFLKWVQTVLKLHKGVAHRLLRDTAVKLDFIRLYHKVCEDQTQGRDSRRIETVRLFTSIMLELIEAQGVPPGDLYHTVLATCLSKTARDDPGEEVGLRLLSLYIHELWSGAKMPELFLSHLRLLTKDQEKGPKQTTSSITRICRDILSALHSSMQS